MKLLSRPSIEEIAIVVIASLAFWIPQQFDSDPSTLAPTTATATATVTATATATVTATATATATATTPEDGDPTPTASTLDECDWLNENERVRGATVRIHVYDADGTYLSHGTGFHIGKGRYVTAAHVIQDELGNTASTIRIVSAKAGTAADAKIVAEGSFDSDHQERDLAILQATPLEDELTWRAPSDNDIDRDVRAVGYPWSQERGDASEIPPPTTLRGTLTNMVTKDGIEIVQAEVRVQPGNSGGPLVDECGTAIAVVSAIPMRERELGDALHSVFEGLPIFISMTELSRVQ